MGTSPFSESHVAIVDGDKRGRQVQAARSDHVNSVVIVDQRCDIDPIGVVKGHCELVRDSCQARQPVCWRIRMARR